MSFLRVKDKRKRRVSPEDMLRQFEQSDPTGLWSNDNARLKPKAWLVGSTWRAVLGKQIVSDRCFDTKADALKEAARQQQSEQPKASNNRKA
jgi:hypothetical protein